MPLTLTLTPTPSQTVGPFFSIGFDPLAVRDIASTHPSDERERITIAGRVVDGNGSPVPDAVLEIWQADANGIYAHPEDAHSDSAHTENHLDDAQTGSAQAGGAHANDPRQRATSQPARSPAFTGFLRVPTNDAGEFRFTTIRPGRVLAPNGALQAPHLAVSIFMRGLLKRLVTRIYFPGEESNTSDFVLSLVEEQRRNTLIARRTSANSGELEWNVILQGENETVFFEV